METEEKLGNYFAVKLIGKAYRKQSQWAEASEYRVLRCWEIIRKVLKLM